MPDPKHFKVSINASLIDKPDRAKLSRHSAKGWEPLELSERQLRTRIKRGHAFSAHYLNTHRRSANFIATNMVAANVEGSMTIEEARANPYVRKYASFLYTTPSHRSDRARFRIVFKCAGEIKDGREWADAILGLAFTLGTDRSIADAGRMFFGNQTAQFYRVGKILTAPALRKLIAVGRDMRDNQRGEPVNSLRQLNTSHPIKLETGSTVPCDSLPSGTQVYCPFHEHARAAAFVVSGWRGRRGIHCKECRLTFWTTSNPDEYDFNAFERLIDEKANLNPTYVPASYLEQFFPPEPSVVRIQQRFLPPLTYEPGITLIKSPKGSGKTAALHQLIANIRNGIIRQGIPRKERPQSILLVGHRQALLREAAKRLDLSCYLDEPRRETGITTLAVSLDSLPKFTEDNNGVNDRSSRKTYDLVILDESEQILAHLLGDTVKKMGLERCYDALNFQISRAKSVIALDADLGLITAHALRTMRPQDWQSRCRVIYNKSLEATSERTLELFSFREPLQRDLLEAIERGDRCFVTSNNKKYLEELHEIIRKKFRGKIKFRIITSETSKKGEVIEFVKNIKSEILNVQVTLCSPSLGTGIDISFPNGEQKIDHVYGFFEPFINTHTDIDQQLSRVRNPGTVKVWLGKNHFRYVSNFDVILDDLARAYFVPQAVTGRTETGLVQYNKDHPLLQICSHVVSARRASMNKLSDLFCELRESNGWLIKRIDEPSRSNGARAAARENLFHIKSEKLLAAPVLTDIDFFELKARHDRREPINEFDQATYARNELERALGQTITLTIIAANKDGGLTGRVEAFVTLMHPPSYMPRIYRDMLGDIARPDARLARTRPEALRGFLAFVAGVDISNPEKIFELSNLQQFALLCDRNRTMIEEVLKQPVRTDVKKNPVRQLNTILAGFGLTIIHKETVGSGNVKIRRYALDPHALAMMKNLAESVERLRAARAEAEAA